MFYPKKLYSHHYGPVLKLIFLFLLFAGCCEAQTGADTLNLAKKLKDANKLKNASDLLTLYRKNHPNDLNGIWLSAQTAYWLHDFKKSISLYKEALAANPGNYYLKLDYAKMLVDIAALKNAAPLLHTYLKYDSTNADALISLAKIDYWQGDYKPALAKVKKIMQKHPGNKDAIALLDEILLAQSPWIRLTGAYNTDDQPLQNFTSSLEAGIFLHPLADLHVALTVPIFLKDGNTSNALTFEVGDKLSFNKEGLMIAINAGLAQFPGNNTTAFTGSVDIAKSFAKYFILTAAAARKPYFYSRSSIDSALIESNFAATAGWNNKHTVNGVAGFSVSRFPDNNSVTTLYATIYAPELKARNFSFQFGYGYNNSNSKENRFVPQNSTLQNITGVYDPYFTPNDQQIHSLITSIAYQPVKRVIIGAAVNYGLYATTQNPYFFVKQANPITIDKNYIEQKFSPVELGAYVLWQATKKINIKATYQYHQTFFYTNQYVGLSLKANFWNEKK